MDGINKMTSYMKGKKEKIEEAVGDCVGKVQRAGTDLGSKAKILYENVTSINLKKQSLSFSHTVVSVVQELDKHLAKEDAGYEISGVDISGGVGVNPLNFRIHLKKGKQVKVVKDKFGFACPSCKSMIKVKADAVINKDTRIKCPKCSNDVQFKQLLGKTVSEHPK